MDIKSRNNSKEFLEAVLKKKEPEITTFYNDYDRLVWERSRSWYSTISMLSKNIYDIDDIHNTLWAHIFKHLHKCDLDRSGISSWINLVCESKLMMMKRHLNTSRNTVLRNEVSYSVNPHIQMDSSKVEVTTQLVSMIKDSMDIENEIELQEKVLDFIYLILELIDTCTDKERKVYLLKIKGKSQKEIVDEADVSQSYIPKVYKNMSKKLKALYESLNSQHYISKKERDSLAKDLINTTPTETICAKYDLNKDTVYICREMLNLIGVTDSNERSSRLCETLRPKKYLKISSK